jgi:hypothetical protein
LLLTIWKKQGIKALPVSKLGMEEPPPRPLHNLMQRSPCFKEHLKKLKEKTSKWNWSNQHLCQLHGAISDEWLQTAER